jgi:hypothetical protein
MFEETGHESVTKLQSKIHGLKQAWAKPALSGKFAPGL